MMAREFLRSNYRFVDLAENLKNKTAQKVNHLAINCSFTHRISTLADLLICYAGEQGKTIVFTQTKDEANSLILSDKLTR
mmetsp:Transcript_33417/g.32463  ORF Transcript_33417/g.32463 Transcript_33417/m.32463 type:complete len:80 (-) Transcript_33417:1452-1691(-)